MQMVVRALIQYSGLRRSDMPWAHSSIVLVELKTTPASHWAYQKISNTSAKHIEVLRSTSEDSDVPARWL